MDLDLVLELDSTTVQFGRLGFGLPYAVARGFGCLGEVVTRAEDVAPAMQWALTSNLPAVLDASGNLKAFASEDGASMFRFDIARAKACGAVGMGASSRVLMQRAKDNPNFFVSLSATSNGKFLPQTGAVVIKDASGQIIGAAGAGGGTGDEDEAICIAGVEAVGLAHG